jgi:hypothetical protein
MAGGSSNLRDSLLPVVDVLRGIPGAFGLRLFTVSVVSRSWSGSRVGLGTNADSSTGVKVDLGVYQTKVRQITQKDVVASGGLYSTQDFEIGPITPPFVGSTADGDAITVFDPAASASPLEIFFNIRGPGFPATGGWFRKVSQNVTGSFRYMFVITRTAEIP